MKSRALACSIQAPRFDFLPRQHGTSPAPRLLQNLRMADAELPRKETIPHLAVATIAIPLSAFEFHAIAGPLSHRRGNVPLPALAIALSGVHLRRNSSSLNG